jgi:hypothetical protein
LRRPAAFAALLAVALQALWPLLAQARPAQSIPVPLCSVDGTRHEIQLPIGKGQDDKGAEHCKLCVLGADKPAVANAAPAFAFAAAKPEGLPRYEAAAVRAAASFNARPRAPPQAS